MPAIKTRITELLNVQTPIISAPMGISQIENIALAVTGAGGFGFIQAGFESTEGLKRVLERCRSELHVSEGGTLPLGVGFVGWALDSASKAESPDSDRISVVLESRPAAVWFAFGNDLGKYISRVRAYKDHKPLIFVNVSSVDEARKAIEEWKTDVLVVQGIESGGHGGSHAPPLSIFIQAILAAFPNGPPIVAAGGIASGSQIASLLVQGAAGIAMGTRFLVTHESSSSKVEKEILIAAGHNDSVRTMALDEVRGTLGWPEGIDGRGIMNDIVRDQANGLSIEERKKNYEEDKKNGKRDRMVIWAGAGVGLVNEATSAADVVKNFHEEALSALKKALQLIQ